MVTKSKKSGSVQARHVFRIEKFQELEITVESDNWHNAWDECVRQALSKDFKDDKFKIRNKL